MKLRRIMQKSLFVNLVLIIVKVITGVLFKSTALVADGVHSMSDMLSDLFVIFGINHSFKPADEDHPFGHGKFEYILSLFLGLSIIVIAYNLGKSVVVSFNDPIVVPSVLSLVVISLVVVSKLILARYLINQGKEQNSEIIKASGLESLSDVLSSALVFIGIIFVFIGRALDIYWLQLGDRVASVLIALFIIRIGIVIILDAVRSLQGKRVEKAIVDEYEKLVCSIEGVNGVDHLEMVMYGPYYQAIIDIVVDGSLTVKEGHDIAENVCTILKRQEKICHASVHVNPGGEEK